MRKCFIYSKPEFFRIRFLIILMVLFIFTIRCNNPFSTREPEKPSGKVVNIRPANQPEDVIHNLEISFENLITDEFLKTFSEDFVFNPDETDSIKYELEFAGVWDKESEMEFTYNFLDSNVVKLISIPGKDSPHYEYHPESDSYEYDYFIDITPMEGSPYVVLGRAYLYFRKNDEDNYEIVRWIDEKTVDTLSSWGELRARYK